MSTLSEILNSLDPDQVIIDCSSYEKWDAANLLDQTMADGRDYHQFGDEIWTVVGGFQDRKAYRLESF